MKLSRPHLSVDREQGPLIAGGLGSLVIAFVIYGQFGLHGWLKRDSAIYMYGGQQMLHNRPPYVSIMDPKGPVAGILCGFGAAVARLFGRSDVVTMRLEYGVITALSVLAVYLITHRLVDSIPAALVAATVFASFEGYAQDAFAGPNGHTPGIVFAIFGVWLTLRRNWIWAGVAGSLAFLTWQPLATYALVTLLCAALWDTENRRQAVVRAVIGSLLPIVVVAAYYAILGQLHAFIVGVFIFPLTGVVRTPMSLSQRISHMYHDVLGYYGFSGVLLWIGFVLFVVVAAVSVTLAVRKDGRRAFISPMFLLVIVGFLAQFLYALYDYQGYSHAFPFMLYSALGFALPIGYGLKALAGNARRVVDGLLIGLAAVVAIAFAVDYHHSYGRISPLRAQEASACAIQESLVPGTPLWSLGNPLPLVLLHRRNPDNYPYLGSGIDYWRINHTPGGFDAWTSAILRSRASILVVDVWHSPVRLRMEAFLTAHGFVRGNIGPWQVFATKAAQQRARRMGIRMPAKGHFLPTTFTGKPFTRAGCSRA